MIRIVATSPNQKGDLLTERMKDLVHALGFNVEYMNLGRTGRELDIIAKHRLENRTVVIECKAQLDKVGGAEINKFIGSLDAERRKAKSRDAAGYFVSLSGFTDSAKAQEADFDNQRCVLLGEEEIKRELEAAHVIVPFADAMVQATRICEMSNWNVSPLGELLATGFGWIWLVKYNSGGTDAAFTLVHADGNSVPPEVASAIARELGNQSINLNLYVRSTDEAVPSEIEEVYRQFIRREYGHVTHEGLPADSRVGQTLDLSELYVPLEVETWREERQLSELTGEQSRERRQVRTGVGHALVTVSK